MFSVIFFKIGNALDKYLSLLSHFFINIFGYVLISPCDFKSYGQFNYLSLSLISGFSMYNVGYCKWVLYIFS